MTDKELGDALLKWDAGKYASGADVQGQVANVLRRDVRKVRRLTIGTVVLWIVAAVGVPLFFFLFCQLVMPKVVELQQEVITHRKGTDPQTLANAARLISDVTLKMGILLVTASVGALLLAGGCTVWLVFATRRATLREVNANLAAVAEHLKRLPTPGEA
jgi:hypothetical protein